MAPPLHDSGSAGGFFLLKGAFPSHFRQMLANSGCLVVCYCWVLAHSIKQHEVMVVVIWPYINTAGLK